MSIEENKAIVRAFAEGPAIGVAKGTHEHFRDHLSPDAVFHTPSLSSEPDHIDGMHAEAQAVGAPFEDLDIAIDWMVAEGDMVTTHLTMSGNHAQTFKHPTGDVLPGGQDVVAGMLGAYRLRDGLITDIWYYSNLDAAIRTSAASL